MKRIYKNWLLLISSSVFTTVVSFVAFILLARKMSVDSYGKFNAIIASVILFATFANNIASGSVINREIALHPKSGRYIYIKSLKLRLIGFVLSLVIMYIYFYFTKTNFELIFISSMVLLVSNISYELFEQIAFGYFITKYTTLINIIMSSIWITFVIIVPINGISLILILSTYSFIFFIKSIIYLRIVNRIIKNNNECYDLPLSKIFSMSSSYLWMRVIGTIGAQVPILLLDNFISSEEVAYYSVGTKFIIPLTLLITTGINALFPFITKLYKENIDIFKEKIIMGFTFVFIFATTFAFLLTLASNNWIPTLFGEDYTKAIYPFKYQVWLSVGLGFDLVLSMVLSSSYKQKTLSIITTIDVLILIPLMYLGINNGAEGISLAKLVGALLGVLYHIILVFKIFNFTKYVREFFYSILYFTLMLVISLMIKDLYLKIILSCTTVIIATLVKQSPIRMLFSVVSNRIKSFIGGDLK